MRWGESKSALSIVLASDSAAVAPMMLPTRWQ